jgi:predicted ferric reductase
MSSVRLFIDRKISRKNFVELFARRYICCIFSFQPGDYVSINLPRVALYEFHPFTISSAPEETGYIRLHIQATGNWTKRVYQRFKEMSESENSDNYVRVRRADLHTLETDTGGSMETQTLSWKKIS